MQMPMVKGKNTTRFTTKFGMQSPSDRNFMIPGGLTLDTDSEVEISKM